jgi:hypothetical protein
VDEEAKVHGKYVWRLNKAGRWAWFCGGSQTTGAYKSHSDAAYAFDAHCLKDDEANRPSATFKDHAEYVRIDAAYGHMDAVQIRDVLDQMSRALASLRTAARREFDGNGGRRYGPAMAAQAARELGQERLLLNAYIQEMEAARG